MKALSDRQQAVIQEQIVKQLCFNCIPLFVALLLLVWLSFGLPHPTWILLLKTIFQAGVLISMQGMAFLLPLIILAIQSIFLLCAWGLLIWGITREVKALRALYEQLSMPVVLSSAGAGTASTAASSPPQDQGAFAPTVLNPYSSNGHSSTSSSTPAWQDNYAPPPPPPVSQNPFEQNPFDEEEDFPTQLTEMSTQFSSLSNVGNVPDRLSTPPDYGRVVDQDISQPLSPAYSWDDSEAETARPTARKGGNEPGPVVEEVEGSLYEKEELDDIQEDIHTDPSQRLRSTSIQRRFPQPGRPEHRRVTDAPSNRSRRQPEPERKPKPPYSPPSIEEDSLAATEIAARSKEDRVRHIEEEIGQEPGEEILAPPVPARPDADQKKRPKQAAASRPPTPVQEDDPFAIVEDDPFAVKEDVLNVFEEEEPAPQEEEQDTSDEDDAVFVFGNPFEGPLPDVFMEDEDLKRTVQEQQANLADEASPAKKGGKKATGIRKRSSGS